MSQMLANQNLEFIQSIYKRKSTFPSPEEALDKANACDIISKDIYTDNTRFIYELLQNADDASNKNGVLDFRVDCVGDYLVVSHCGKAFTKDDIESICSIGDGTKIGDGEQTGFKGIGFKSVFAHSECVVIKSGGFCFKFDKQEAVVWNPVWGERKAWEQKRAAKGKDTRIKMPWQIIPLNTSLPNELHNLFKHIGNYTVSTIIKCKDITSIKTEIENLFSTSQIILFLRSEKVSVSINGTQEQLSITKRMNNGVITISKNGEVVSSWLMKTTKPFDVPANIRKKMEEDSDHYPEKLREATKTSMSFAVAIKDNNIVKIDAKQPNIFAFLPTTITDYSFPFIVNANFITDAGRQNLHKDYVWNQWLFEEMPKHYMSWMAEIAKDGKYGLGFLKVIAKTASAYDALSDKYNTGMRAALENIAFLPINGRLIKVNEAVFDKTNIFSCLGENMLISYLATNGKHYLTENVLPQSYSSYVCVLKSLSVCVFENDQLENFLKSPTFQNAHSVSENARLIDFLCTRYPISTSDNEETEDVAWLKELPFVFSENNILRSPVQLCFPSTKYVAELKNSFETISPEVFDSLSQNSIEWLRALGMSEPSDTSLIDTGKLFEEGYVTTENAIEIARYIFKLHRKVQLSYDQYEKLKNLDVLTQKNTLKKASVLYLSTIYVPEVPLEDVVDIDMFVSSEYADTIGTPSEWKVFFEKIGVTTTLSGCYFTVPRTYDTNTQDAIYYQQYVKELFSVAETFGWQSYNGWVDLDVNQGQPKYDIYHFTPRVVHFYGIPYLNYALDFAFSKILWKHIIHTISIKKILENRTCLDISGDTGWFNRTLPCRLLSSKHVDYLQWCLLHTSIIPASDGVCHKACDVYSNTMHSVNLPELGTLLRTYLPIIEYDESLNPDWENLLGLKTCIGLPEYLYVLSKISESSDLHGDEKKGLVRLYEEISHIFYSLTPDQKNSISDWANNNKILAKDGQFYPPSELSIILIDGFANNKIAYVGSDSPSKELIEIMKLMGVKVIDHVVPMFSGTLVSCDDLKRRLCDIVPLIACVKGDDNDDKVKNVVSKLSFYSVEEISLSYGNENDTIYKTVYCDKENNTIYIKGDWQSVRVIDGLEQPLGQILHLNKDCVHMLGILLTATLSDCIDYLKEYGIVVPEKVIESLRENEIVSVRQFQQEDGDWVDISVSDSIYGGLSKKEMADYLSDAKELVRRKLEEQHYDFSNARGLDASTFGSIYGVKDPKGNPCPLVVHSYRNMNRSFALTAMDWQQLAQRNSMLWIVTSQGPKCVPFYQLMANQGQINLSFNVDNVDCKERMIAFAEILRYFKGLHFDFGSLRDTFMDVAERFNQPEQKMEEVLEADNTEALF